MGVSIEVSLWDAVAGALEDDGDCVDVESAMFEEIPGNFPRSGTST